MRTKYFLSEHAIAAPGTADVVYKQNGYEDRECVAYFDSLRALRIDFLHYLLWKDTYYAGGHVPFNNLIHDEFKSYYKFVTVLRHPVDRYISEYFYNYNRNHHAKVNLSIPEYMESVTGQRNAFKLCEYLCGDRTFSVEKIDKHLMNSKVNLSKFDVIGFTDNMDSFKRQLKQTLGRSIGVGRENKRTVSSRKIDELVTPSLKDRITHMCAKDIELYEYAKEKFFDN